MPKVLGGAKVVLTIDDSRFRRGIKLSGEQLRAFARDAGARFRSVKGASQESAKATAGAWKDASGRLRDARERFVAMGRAADQAGTQVERTAAAMQRASFAGVSMSGMLSRVAAGLAGFFTLRQVARLLTSAARESAEFGKQLAFVSTMLDTRTLPLMGRFSLALTDFAARFGEGTQTLSKGLFDILSASIDARDAVDFLRVSVESAKGGFTDTAITTDALTTIVNAYGLAASDAGRISDELFAVVKRGKTTFGELASQIGQVASIAATLDVPLEEVGAAIATMTRSGLSTADAVTSLRSILVQILRPTDEFEEASRRLGVEIDAAKLRAVGLTGVLQEIAQLGPTAAGELFRRVEAIRGLAILLPNLEGFIKDVQFVADSAGQRQEALAKALDTTATKWSQVWEQLKNVAREGGALDSLSGSLAETASVIIRGLNDAISLAEGAFGTQSKAQQEREQLIQQGLSLMLKRGEITQAELQRALSGQIRPEDVAGGSVGAVVGGIFGASVRSLKERSALFERAIAAAKAENAEREKGAAAQRAAEQRAARQRAKQEALRLEQARQRADIERQIGEIAGEFQRTAGTTEPALEAQTKAAELRAKGDRFAAQAVGVRARAERQIAALLEEQKGAMQELADLRSKLRLVSEEDRKKLEAAIRQRQQQIEQSTKRQIELVKRRANAELEAINQVAKKQREAERERRRQMLKSQVSTAIETLRAQASSVFETFRRIQQRMFAMRRLEPSIIGTVTLAPQVAARTQPTDQRILAEIQKQTALQQRENSLLERLAAKLPAPIAR